jgi:uncharacterized protein
MAQSVRRGPSVGKVAHTVKATDRKTYGTIAPAGQGKIFRARSRARGDSTWESDLDVCVVLDELTYEDRHTIWDIAWEVGFEHDVLISTVAYSRDEFEQGPCSESPLVLNILQEGVPV